MSMRMVLKSTDSQSVNPFNKPWDFRVRLPTPLALVGYWTVELTEFHNQDSTKKEMFVYCSICDDSIVGEKQVPLLRRIYSEVNTNIIFTAPYQIPLRSTDLTDIHLYIKDTQDENASFLTTPSTVTLLFRRHSL